ncbi:hypothetical protein DXA09_11115 [Absiella sp. AM54-8XD]|uniref:PTS transporter subunit EIIB n=1 Tax=Absiella sp. AM54-8XD TaxID=2292279 RepID=UPI000E41C012|nr:PTS transporter subunit EIIB [Absiella sp. AM54-8XD]RGC21443.1 hypothetical protein DXA09_11115 [Absiella sp. AM54-8XD]
MKTNENFERELLQLVGGSENVISATHCMTRLRLRLKDENKAKTDDIKKNERRYKCSDQQWSISNSDWNARYRSL